MIDPFTAMFVISSATKAVGTSREQSAANAAYEYQAKLAEANAGVARMEGNYAFQAAHRAEIDARKKGRAFAGNQRAAMAGSGLALSSGSFQDITADTLEGVELDAAAIRYGGELDLWRADVQASNLTAQAKGYRASKGDPKMAAATSIIGSMGQWSAATYDAKAK